MNINTFTKVFLILLLVIGSIYFANNILKANKVKEGVVIEQHLTSFRGQEEVIAFIYGEKACPYCKLAVAELEKHNINYIYKDIKKSQQALQEFTKLKGRETPLLITRYMKITGFNEQWFTKEVLIQNTMPPKTFRKIRE
ncbi:MAG: glutaredoxin family protein [Alteromonadaceae bacterium]|nr:glutaredoxin family protein [Alteromonadaceae bacterium]